MAILYEVGFDLFTYEECQNVIFRTLDQVKANQVRDIIGGQIRTQELDKTIWRIHGRYHMPQYDPPNEPVTYQDFTDDLDEGLERRSDDQPEWEQVYPIITTPHYSRLVMISGNMFSVSGSTVQLDGVTKKSG